MIAKYFNDPLFLIILFISFIMSFVLVLLIQYFKDCIEDEHDDDNSSDYVLLLGDVISTGDYCYDESIDDVSMFLDIVLGKDNDLYAVMLFIKDNKLEVYRTLPDVITKIEYCAN